MAQKTTGVTTSKTVQTGQDFAFLGIACTLAWAFFINATRGTQAIQQLPWQLSYIFLAGAMLVFGYCANKAPGFLASKRAGATFAALGAIGSLALTLSPLFDPLQSLQIPISILCACVLGWLYLQWGLFYSNVGLKMAIGCLFIANIAGSVFKTIGHFLPLPASCILIAALPIGSVLLCWRALKTSPHTSATVVRFESHNLPGLRKPAIAIIAFSFVTAFLLARFSGNQSAVPAMDFTLARLFEVCISLLVVLLVLKLNRTFNFSQLWRILVIVLAADMLCQALVPQVAVIRCVESSAWDLLVLFTWITLADIARHAYVNTPLVFGIGWACYAAPFALGSIAAFSIPVTQNETVIGITLMFILLMVTAFCLEQRDQDTKWIFAELTGEQAAQPVEHRSIDERCKLIAEQNGLTPRELEIMQLLCKGRTKAYIAESLYLTENTVKSHAKHIYTKLDVHSKQELMNLVEQQSADKAQGCRHCNNLATVRSN